MKGWVVEALSSNSALPEAVTGGGGRGRGDDSDEEDDEEEEPLDQVQRQQQKHDIVSTRIPYRTLVVCGVESLPTIGVPRTRPSGGEEGGG